MSPVPGKRYDPDFGKLAFDGKVCSRDCEALELAYEEEEDSCAVWYCQRYDDMLCVDFMSDRECPNRYKKCLEEFPDAQ
jgi:hypothetical protein